MADGQSAQSVRECRAAAKAAGIPWSWVCSLKNELVQLEREKRRRSEEIRQLAWHAHVGPDSGSAPFWRHGFLARFGARIAKGADFTCIPGYDLIASAVAEHYPEFGGDHAGDVSGTAELFEFLLSEYEPWPPRSEFYWEALEELQMRVTSCESRGSRYELVPF